MKFIICKDNELEKYIIYWTTTYKDRPKLIHNHSKTIFTYLNDEIHNWFINNKIEYFIVWDEVIMVTKIIINDNNNAQLFKLTWL